MKKFGKGIFGKGFDLKAEVTNGECPLCNSSTIFVSLYHNVYRCMNCGGDTEQKINGVIKFMPIGQSGMKDPPLMKLMDEDGPHEA